MAGTAQIDACATAVQANLTNAASICAPANETIDVFSSDGLSEACISALKAGQQAAKVSSKLPEQVRAGLVRDFDAKLAHCKAPPPTAPVPKLDIVHEWD